LSCSIDLRSSQCDGHQADQSNANQNGNRHLRSPLRQEELEHRDSITDTALKWPERTVAAANDQADPLNAEGANRQG